MTKQYAIGSADSEWGDGIAQTLTFIVTEDCNLRCKYCYITHKAKNKALSFETAKRFIDYILNEERINKNQGVLLDFIGGEPLLEVNLIREICDYFKIKTYEMGLDWYWNYRIDICTNGVNYDSEAVQNFIKGNEGKLSIGITLDGTKQKHDLQRIFPDGTGSYDVIKKNIPLWLEQFHGSTKVTFASADLIYLKDSIIDLWNQGIVDISANVVYENVWKDGDDDIFESQLKKLADYIISNELYNSYTCTLFMDHIGHPYSKAQLNNTSCGAGRMLALAPNGKIYPCMRYYDYSLNNKMGYIVGDINGGIDFEKLRPFRLTMYKYQSDNECLNCPIATGCEFCQGFNYDEAATDTNFQRAKYICNMHKARVRANNYYFSLLKNLKGIKRNNYYWENEMIFLINGKYTSFCSYENQCGLAMVMGKEEISNGLRFSEKNFLRPVFVYSKYDTLQLSSEYDGYDILYRIPIEIYNPKIEYVDHEIIVSEDSINNLLSKIPKQDRIILNINSENIANLYVNIVRCFGYTNRINLNIMNISPMFNLNEYSKQLSMIKDAIVEYFKSHGRLIELNVLTDLLFVDCHEQCSAGENSITYAPDGEFYICPAFFSENEGSVGNIVDGIKIENQHLLYTKMNPLCDGCNNYQCENCRMINKMFTNEVNISPSFQCLKASIERKQSFMLYKLLENHIENLHVVEDTEVIDPICYVAKGVN